MKHFFYLAAIAAATASLMACNKTEVNCLDEVTTNEVNSIPTTKAIGAKSPILAVYVETNDVNPLNAVDYYLTMKTNQTSSTSLNCSHPTSTRKQSVA